MHLVNKKKFYKKNMTILQLLLVNLMKKTAVESAWNAEAQGALTAFGDEKDFQLQGGETLEEYKQRLLETGKFSSEGAVEAFVEGMASGDFSSSEAIANALGAKSADKVLKKFLKVLLVEILIMVISILVKDFLQTQK